MKNNIVFILVSLFLFLNPSPLRAEESFKSTLNPSATEIYRREPLKTVFSWKNISKKDQKLFIQSQEFFIYVAFGSEEFKRYRLFYPEEEERLEHLSPIWSISALLKPQQVHEHRRWLLLAQRDGNSQWDFLFDKPGTYHISMNADGKDAVQIIVKDLTLKADQQALKFFSRDAAQLFLGEEMGAKATRSLLEKIFSKYPKSLYAPYAALGLANHEWQKQSGFDLDFRSFTKYLDFIINKYSQNRPLFEEALFMTAQALVFQKGGQEKALEYFSILQREFPSSRYILELQEDYGIGLEIIPSQP